MGKTRLKCGRNAENGGLSRHEDRSEAESLLSYVTASSVCLSVTMQRSTESDGASGMLADNDMLRHSPGDMDDFAGRRGSPIATAGRSQAAERQAARSIGGPAAYQSYQYAAPGLQLCNTSDFFRQYSHPQVSLIGGANLKII